METLFALLTIVGIGTLVLAAILLPVVVSRLPVDYFNGGTPLFKTSHPGLFIIRNVIGGFLVLIGFVMLILPGQGVLTILAGLIVMDFPGKKRIEVFIAHNALVFRSLNWIRSKNKKPPFDPPITIDST